MVSTDTPNTSLSGIDSNVEAMIRKLLDKAGKDPRLTPRLLREKTEQKLQYPQGTLKTNREEIKRIILKWWDEYEKTLLKKFIRIGKAGGHAPAIFKGIKDMSDVQDMINTLKTRLREKGMTFSDDPTEEELLKLEKEYEMKRDLDGLDKNDILDSGVKRKSSTTFLSNHIDDDDNTNSNHSNHKKKSKSLNFDEDEEAEF